MNCYYKNIGSCTKSYFGIEIKPGECKQFPNHIVDDCLIKVDELPKPAVSEVKEEAVKVDRRRTRRTKTEEVEIPVQQNEQEEIKEPEEIRESEEEN